MSLVLHIYRQYNIVSTRKHDSNPLIPLVLGSSAGQVRVEWVLELELIKHYTVGLAGAGGDKLAATILAYISGV